MIKFLKGLCLVFLFTAISFADDIIAGKTVITGDEMNIKKSGDVTVSKGNSKAVNGRNTIESHEMTYDKKLSMVSAAGDVRLSSKTDEGEPVKAYGDFAEYHINTEKGKLWGEKSIVKYFMKDSVEPLLLNAKEIYLDKNLETLSAYKDVEVITSSGTIYSDNAVFDKKTDSVVMVKDEKRPTADVIYDGRKGYYEADKMIFHNSDDNKKIIMNGNVTGIIEMEDKIQ